MIKVLASLLVTLSLFCGGCSVVMATVMQDMDRIQCENDGGEWRDYKCKQ
jgi:hypothetical protein